MNLFDNETKILSFFRDRFRESETALIPFDSELPDLLRLITPDSQWEKWVNSSGKAEPPPDFYCDEFALMMEVMRIDDHAYTNGKGKVVNHVNARESKMQKELQDSGIVEQFPNLKYVICNPKTELETKEDHNYTFYVSNFIRTIEDHVKKINLYRRNHPNFKLIFFIMDESSAYMQAINPSDTLDRVYEGRMMQGTLHQYWEDEAFVRAIYNSEVDYLIWFTPWKYIQLQEGGHLHVPKTFVFDIKRMSIQTQKYNPELMVSSEA